MVPELLQKHLNELSESNKAKRRMGYKRIQELTANGPLDPEIEFKIIQNCLKGFEDSSEGCREDSVAIVTSLVVRQPAFILDWILPSIVARIGVLPLAEKCEEIRLCLLNLAFICVKTFPHDIGPKNYIDFFQVLLAECFKDSFSEIRKLACQLTEYLCSIEPVRIRTISPILAKSLKENCILFKHSSVREISIQTLASLIRCGAVEVLNDEKDKADRETTVFQLYILCNDRCENVRFAVLGVLSCSLLEIKERLEYHRKLIPHLLLLTTDNYNSVSRKAIEILKELGDLYMMDNEDNSVNLHKRRITMKDIEWYGDDEYPDMNLSTIDRNTLPILSCRPPLGARYAVAEAVRNFIPRIISDVTSIDWVISLSTTNRKSAALRTLWVVIFLCEKSIVQFAAQILSALYKSLCDESEDVRRQSAVCIEILGKFLHPDDYLSFLTAKPDSSETEEEIIIKTNAKTVIVSPANQSETQKVTTLFSVAAVTVKCGILRALFYLVKGSVEHLAPSHALRIVSVLISEDLLESENEDLLLSLLETLGNLIPVFAEKNFISTPQKPLKVEVKNDPHQRTLDSILLYALLRVNASPIPTLKVNSMKHITALSTTVTGDATAIFSLHLERLLVRYGSVMPVDSFSQLILGAEEPSLVKCGELIKTIFLQKLISIDFTVRVADELQYLVVLEKLLWRKSLLFDANQLEELIRAIIIPLGTFRPGRVPQLFRKVSLNCVCALLQRCYRSILSEALSLNNCALSEKIITLWSSGSDSDEAEIRLICSTSLVDVCCLPMTQGSAHDIVESVSLRFDDSNDAIRLQISSGLLNSLIPENETSPVLKEELKAQMVSITKKVLIYLDDTDEHVGIRPVLGELLKKLGEISPDIVVSLVREALPKQSDAKYCNDVLNYLA